MLAQNRDMGWLSPLFLACPLRQRHFNFPSQWEQKCTSIHSFISKCSPGKRLFAWLDSISTFGRRLLFFTLMGLSSVQAATTCTEVTEIPQAECETLIAFYNSTNGAGWFDSATNNWNMTNTPCSWTGIFCSGGHVVTISRYQHNLVGSIPDLSALTQLWSLDLNHNQLTGPIPNLSALTRLQWLDLNHNQLTGTIPDLSALTSLRLLDLSRNQLCGEIPSSLVKSTLIDPYFYLYRLRLDNNHLTTSDPTIIALLNSEHNENYLDWTNQTPCVGTGTGTITATAKDIISTVAGTGVHGYDGEGIATSKMLGWPMGIAVDSADNLYIADRDNHRIRKVDSTGNITTVAGTGVYGYNGEGVATSKMLAYPMGVAVDSAGNLYIADIENSRIRKVDSAGNMTTVAGTGTVGYDGEGVATSKMLSTPSGVAVDSAGNLYIADMDNHRIRKVDSAGNMTTVAGTGTAGYDDEGVATSKMLNSPAGIAVDNADNLYIADMDNQRIRKVDSTGNMTTVAGPYFKVCNICPFSGFTPSGVVVDSLGNLFIADQFNYRINKVDNVGNVTTVAGTGTPGYNGEGIATIKKLTPSGVAVDSAGNLFIADLINNRIRKVVFNAAPAAPVANNVSISLNPTGTPTFKIGEILKGNYTYSDAENDPEGTSTFQWYTVTDTTCTTEKTAISGATSQTYTLTSSEVDKYLCFEVIPVATSGASPGTAVLTTSSSTVVVTPGATPLPKTINLTINFSGNGHGGVITDPSGIDCDSSQSECSYSFDIADWINLIPTAAADSQFTGWSSNQTGCEDGKLFMIGSHSCTAYFELLRFPLTITTVGQGQVSSDPVGIHCGDQCQSPFDINTNVTLTAIPEKGWQFQEWSGDCNNQGQVVMKENQACQATFTPLPPDFPPVADAILTTCTNAITWDGQSHEEAVVKNTDTLNLIGSSTPIKIKALCNYGTIQETAGEPLSIQVNSTDGFIYNEGRIFGKDGQSSTAKSTIPTNLINEGDNGSSIKLNAGTQLYHQGIIQAGAGGNGYFKAGQGGSVEIYANQIIQTGTISAGNGGEGNAHQPEWDGVWGGDTIYGNQPVRGGNGGKTVLQAVNSLNATASATTSSGMGGNAYVWCRNGAHLIDWEFDGRWYKGTCVSDSNVPIAIPTPGSGGDLIKLSPSLYDLSQASSGKGLYYEPSTITMGPETRLQAQEDIFIFGGDDWVLDLRHLSPGAISTRATLR